jgi:hypothetical protein
MSKHTPGPWEWRGNVLFTASDEFRDHFVLCPKIVRVHGDRMSPSIACSDVDRALLAAAPDLLAACEEALAAIDADNVHMEVGRHYAVDDARGVLSAAIAKAKGETK